MKELFDFQVRKYPKGIPFAELFETEEGTPDITPGFVFVRATLNEGKEVQYTYELMDSVDDVDRILEGLVHLGYDSFGYEPGSAHETIPVLAPAEQAEELKLVCQIF